jgi:hypothetical protein
MASSHGGSPTQAGALFDRLKFLLVLLAGDIQIPSELQVHPETGRHAQELLQPQSSVGRDPPMISLIRRYGT